MPMLHSFTMGKLIMLLILVSISFQVIVLADRLPGLIPSAKEQVNLLTNVEEVLARMQSLVNDEANSTAWSVIQDVEKIVDRAQDQLSLVEEFALLKVSCGKPSDPDCPKRVANIVSKNIEEAKLLLRSCLGEAVEAAEENSMEVTKVSEYASQQTQSFLDTLAACAKKLPLELIPCYRRAINQDVQPLKFTILKSIEDHQVGHYRSIKVRQNANNCVDNVINLYQEKVMEILSKFNNCS